MRTMRRQNKGVYDFDDGGADDENPDNGVLQILNPANNHPTLTQNMLTNNNSSIGLPASGSGDIASFQAINK